MEKKVQVVLPLETKSDWETTTYYFYRLGNISIVESETEYHEPEPVTEDED